MFELQCEESYDAGRNMIPPVLVGPHAARGRRIVLPLSTFWLLLRGLIPKLVFTKAAFFAQPDEKSIPLVFVLRNIGPKRNML